MSKRSKTYEAGSGVKKAMEQFKDEVANELGVHPTEATNYWSGLTSRQCGSVGGEMVKRMIAQYEQQQLKSNN